MAESFTSTIESTEQCYFRAQLFYQTVQPWHIVDVGLEFDMNISTGINRARFPNDLALEAPGNEARLAEAIQGSLTIVPPESRRGDESVIRKKLESAVTWGNEDELKYLLRSCYVTEANALPALAEASMRGCEGCVAVLLQAGVSGSATIPNSSANKNALHTACEYGQEECAKLIISSFNNANDIYKTCTSGADEVTCFDLLQRNDMKSMARRLEDHCKTIFGQA